MRWPWQKPEPKKPPECDHKYKDFPWYVIANYDYFESQLTIKTIEPYVCVICGNRIDRTLRTISKYAAEEADALKILNKYERNHVGKIACQEDVEDMIADTQLVDREFLKYYELVHGDTSDTPKIEVDENPPKGREYHYTSPDQVCQWIMAKHGIEPYASHFKDVRGWEVHTIKPLTKEEINNSRIE